MHGPSPSTAFGHWGGTTAALRGPMLLAVSIAVLLHLALLLGLRFELPEPVPPPLRTLEVMTVEQPARGPADTPADAGRAQVDRAGDTQAPLPEVTADSSAAASTWADTADRADTEDRAPALPPTDHSGTGTDGEVHTQPTRNLLDTGADAMVGMLSDLGAEVPLPELATAAPARKPAPDARTIFATRGDEIAALNARIKARDQERTGRERRKAISTNTKEYRYASYLDAWRRKVERIGNLNYPQEAKEKALFGSLILHVAVRADGSLEGVRVVRSSGHEVLDQAAVSIVQLAAPFAPFPDDIKAETDVLDITRVWQFQPNHRLGWND